MAILRVLQRIGFRQSEAIHIQYLIRSKNIVFLFYRW